ncbi:helix-hairpin-helix domain-containing protein [Pedobacter sp. BS3]|uniref:helix-hairpin-helix domain-containing protein n=1 Tax=Pedobacter sp. BS3 TaxID=2567937 RepID=UPI0011EEDB30|nr:helix-hairpin-helix domain-containing protein [Pedobacter sp. BS3]TZF82293.1 helix-hairpin-helix domain-containing protein [Pedobacter sp. BS3]
MKPVWDFTKKELNGLLVFCIIIVAVALFPILLESIEPAGKAYQFEPFIKETEAFLASAQPAHVYSYRQVNMDAVKAKPQYFVFDPNNLQEDGWLKLGLSRRQAHIIRNYVSKGGRFYKKEDLKKIYSITPDDYNRLEPYIDIPSSYQRQPYEKKTYAARPAVNVELNSADSLSLLEVRGIGASFARRIIKYRDRLGGFHSKEQLMEVWGMDSLRYQQIENQVSINATLIKPLPVNTATLDDLKRFPYLTYKQMNAIIQYRKQHGNYHSVDDLRKIVLLDEATLNKIRPYLVFE